jgi:hypothetical protein
VSRPNKDCRPGEHKSIVVACTAPHSSKPVSTHAHRHFQDSFVTEAGASLGRIVVGHFEARRTRIGDTLPSELGRSLSPGTVIFEKCQCLASCGPVRRLAVAGVLLSASSKPSSQPSSPPHPTPSQASILRNASPRRMFNHLLL